MAELGQLLGTLLSSLAHARRIADEETTVIAEYYKDHPLLEGMSLPRIRVPEMVLDVPLLIESHEAGESSVPQATGVITKALVAELRESAAQEQVKLSPEFIKAFTENTTRTINKLKPANQNAKTFPREVVIRAVDQSFRSLARKMLADAITPTQTKNIVADLRKKASEVALKKQGSPPTIEASIITADVKEKASSATISRLKLTLKEEGLEWSISEADDGSRQKTLTPE